MSTPSKPAFVRTFVTTAIVDQAGIAGSVARFETVEKPAIGSIQAPSYFTEVAERY